MSESTVFETKFAHCRLRATHVMRALACCAIFLSPLLPLNAQDASPPLKLTISTPRQTTETTLAGPLARIFRGDIPKSVDELKMMDAHQRELVQRVTPTTVAIQVGATQGSGVIVHSEGVILTAAHVARRPGLRADIILSDGQRVQGTTLGMNKNLDAGLIQLDASAPAESVSGWPFAEMGDASRLAPGSWCLALGHSGGYQTDRGAPNVRLGRILSVNAKKIETDCKLVGGDSGGPLMDMEGRVIGINSRIGLDLNKNIHVPVDAFRQHWDRLASGESWGSFLGIIGRPIIGVHRFDDSDLPKVRKVEPGSPAERAGILAGDMITKFNDQEVKTFSRLVELVQKNEPGDEVTIELQRNGKIKQVNLMLGAAR